MSELLLLHDQLVSEKDRLKSTFDEHFQSSNVAKQKYEQSTDPNMMNKLKKTWQNQLSNAAVAKNDWQLKCFILGSVQKKWKTQVIPAFYSCFRSLEEYRLTAVQDCLETVIREEQLQTKSLVDLQTFSLNEILTYSAKIDSETSIPIPIQMEPESEEELYSIDTSKPFQVVLLNMLHKSLSTVAGQESKISNLKKEINGLSKLFNAYNSNSDLGDPDQVLDGT